MPRSRIQSAKARIVRFFRDCPATVFSDHDLREILASHRQAWGIADRMRYERFRTFLLEQTDLRCLHLTFRSERAIRYTRNGPDPLELAMSIKPAGYLSHRSALLFHNLLAPADGDYFVNVEQSPKPRPTSPLIQENIDRAFQKRDRESNNYAEWDGNRIVLLSGKATGAYRVIEGKLDRGQPVRVTDLARTLIDIVVRPSCAGGPHAILTAYQKAAGSVPARDILGALKKLNHIYPFHQAIGFYAERAGNYDLSFITALQRRPKEFNFYLDRQMEDPLYSEKWRIYYPCDLD